MISEEVVFLILEAILIYSSLAVSKRKGVIII